MNEPVTDHDPNDEALQHRLRRNMVFVIVIALVVGYVWSGWRMVFGVALGGAAGWLNVRWLTGSIRGILSQAVVMQNGRVPPFTAGKLILRYYLIAFIIGAAV